MLDFTGLVGRSHEQAELRALFLGELGVLCCMLWQHAIVTRRGTQVSGPCRHAIAPVLASTHA